MELRSGPAEPPIACTLDAARVPGRLAEWRSITAQVRTRTSAADGAARLEFGPDVDVAELSRLMVAEQQCCAFFAFTLTVDHHGVALEVRAPHGADEVVAALFADR